MTCACVIDLMVRCDVWRCVSVSPQLHGPAISDSPELRSLVERLGTSQAGAWERLQGRINSTLCLVSFLRSSTIS